MKLLNLSKVLVLLIAQVIWTSPLSPAQSFEVETLTRTYNYTKPTTFGPGYNYFGGNGHSSTYTRGMGATNEGYSFEGWWIDQHGYNHLFNSTHNTNITEWSWNTVNNSLFGAWRTAYNRVRNHYRISAPPWVSIVVTNENTPRYFDHTTPSLRDFTADFSGPVGTITNLYYDGATSTDTYTTTAGIFVPGDPASTNEHFYRVRLSLKDSDSTPINIPGFVASYLGQPIDSDTNVYVWLGEGKSYTAKPVFKPIGPPSFYSYGAEVNQAQQLSTLIVSTIRRGSTWPGARPAGMAQRMGYPSDEGYFSDDQFAFDYIMNGPLTVLIEAAINSILLARRIPIFWEKDHSRGVVADLRPEERKYMTLVLLGRSVNADPPSEMDFEMLERFKGTNYVYRLLNELGIEAAAYNGSFGHAVTGRHIQRKQTKIGKTKIDFEDDVILRVKVWPGTPIEYVEELGLDKDDLNPIVNILAQAFSNDPGAGHDTLQGGAKGSESINLICAGKAGMTLRTLEQPLLRRMPPDFFCWATFFVEQASNYVDRRVKLSLNSQHTWPTFFEYHYDFADKKYYQRPSHDQIENPFDGFLSLGP